MRKIKTVAVAAALAAVAMQAAPTASLAQPEERAREWRDRAPDESLFERQEREWERRGRTDIDCPLGQVRREITTPLPEGWWNTPIVDNLSSTEVQTIGGRRTLVCKYGPAGQIMMLEPRRRDCVATRRGFDCRRSRGGRPGGPGPFPGGPGGPGDGRSYSEGSVELRQTFQVDFENGRTGSGGGADLWFRAVTSSELYLEPLNGARIAWMGGEGGRRDCREADLRGERISLGRVNVGTTICYRTDQGRLGQFRVTGFSNTGGGRVIRLDYETWNAR